MTKYLGDSFSVHPGASKAYRDNYDSIFGKHKKDVAEKKEENKLPEPRDIPPAPPELEAKPTKKKVKPSKKSKPKKAKKAKK